MTPEDIAKAGTEHAHQCALFCWANTQIQSGAYPMLEFMHANPSGGKRSKITGARMKAEGAKKGVWDIFLPYPIFDNVVGSYTCCGLYIEMKKPGKGRLTIEQKIFQQYVVNQGYATAVCFGWIEAKDAILRYLPRPS